MSVPRFWREIPERYNLEASKCGSCGDMHFPPREVCPKCRRASIGRMTPQKLSGRGTIVEFTRVHKAAPGYEMLVPYFVALVQTEEGPVLTGQIVDSPPDAIKAGAPVKAVFRRLGEDGAAGVIYYGTKWQVAKPTTQVTLKEAARQAAQGAKPAEPKQEPKVRKGLLGRKKAK